MFVRDIIAGRNLLTPRKRQYQPKISIVTPTYCRNGEGLLKKCIESALAQTFTDFELIIIDDGSRDGSKETILDYAKRDHRIVYYRHEQNSGLPAVRTNEGIMLAQGEAIAFLFDDNIYSPDFLQRAFDALHESQADVIHTNVKMLSDKDDNLILGDVCLLKELLKNLNTIPNGGVLCRKSFFDKYGLYDPHIIMRRVCDWDLWLRSLSLGAKFHYIDMISCIEHGIISKNSIGNTINLDIKTAFTYLNDESNYRNRCIKLHPSNIANYDVLNLKVLSPYVRDEEDWQEMVATNYEPFLQKFNIKYFDPNWVTNREKASLPEQGRHSFIRKKRRILFVSNLITEEMNVWMRTLNQHHHFIVINCAEWVLSAYSPNDIDMLILVDCTSAFIFHHMLPFKTAHVPIVYVLMYGNNAKKEYERVKLPPAIRDHFYLPWEHHRKFKNISERDYIENVDLVIADKKAMALRGFKQTWICDLNSIKSITHSIMMLELAKILSQLKSQLVRLPKVLIALNSELLAGSEMYGLMIARNLSSLGLPVIVTIPEKNVYGVAQNVFHLNEWLKKNGLENVSPAPYRSNVVIHSDEQALKKRLQDYLKVADVDIIICCGSFPIFSEVCHDKQLVLMGFFQPTAYPKEHLFKMRDKMDGWITDAKWSQLSLAEILHAPSAVIRSTFPIDILEQPQIQKKHTQIRIAIGGTLQPRKGQMLAICAMKLLREQGLNVVLNIYGYELPMLKDYVLEMKRAIKTFKLSDAVTLHGFTSIAEIVTNNDIILCASLEESLPQTIAECMWHGLIPVTTLVGGIDEIVLNGINGYICDEAMPQSIASTLALAIREESRWQAMRMESQKLLTNEFSAEVTTKTLLNFMLDLATLKLLSSNEGKPVVSVLKQTKLHKKNQLKKHFKKPLRLSKNHWDLVAPTFFMLKNFTKKHFYQEQKHKLVVGKDLRKIPYREYTIPFKIDKLSTISFALEDQAKRENGHVGVEIVSHEKKIITNMVIPLKSVRAQAPVQFQFTKTLKNIKGGWKLRFYTRDCECPIRLYELIKVSLFKIEYLPFVLFQ